MHEAFEALLRLRVSAGEPGGEPAMRLSQADERRRASEQAPTMLDVLAWLVLAVVAAGEAGVPVGVSSAEGRQEVRDR